MRSFLGIADTWFDVVVIGSGLLGAGILRDLSMRGLKTLLINKTGISIDNSFETGTYLSGGAAYAVSDPQLASECAAELKILKRIAGYSVKFSGGLFVRKSGEKADYEERWVKACGRLNIDAKRITPSDALRRENGLTPDIASAYATSDASADGRLLVWHNIFSALRYGGLFLINSPVADIERSAGKITGVRVVSGGEKDEIFIPCGCVVNASGADVSRIASLAGVAAEAHLRKETYVAFNTRFCSGTVTSLKPEYDGRVFVPGSYSTVFGPASVAASDPGDAAATANEARYLYEMAEDLFPEIASMRVSRVDSTVLPFSGGSEGDLLAGADRFVMLDHAKEGLKGMISVFGGTASAYRLYAERAADLVCSKFFLDKKCRTGEEELIPELSGSLEERARAVFPEDSAIKIYSRLGPWFEDALKKAEADPEKRKVLCGCEAVTLAEYETVSENYTGASLCDVREKTGLGFGICGGIHCGFKSVGIIYGDDLNREHSVSDMLVPYLEKRWAAVRSAGWGEQLSEAEFARNTYIGCLNIAGGQPI